MFIVRVIDPNSAGGLPIKPRLRVLSSGSPLAGFSSPVTPHPCCGGHAGCTIHCAATIVPAPIRVFADGMPVHVTGQLDTCGHVRAKGDLRVMVGK